MPATKLPVRTPRGPALDSRPLLTIGHAQELAELFQTLANDTRLRLLHALVRAEEIRMTDLAAAVGMKPQAVSNQLRRLVLSRILGTRREGNSVYYRIVDPCVPSILSYGLCLAETMHRREPCVAATAPRERAR